MSHGLRFAGHTIRLLPERAVWMPDAATLLIADLHLGKGEIFRAAGIAVPSGTTAADLERLGRLIDCTGAERLVVLGDFAHAEPAPHARWPARFAAWRRRRASLSIAVIAGNHDRAIVPPPDWDLEWHARPLEEGGIVHRHEPCEADPRPAFCGHLHPAVRLARGRDRMRLPCFVAGPGRLVLPAFGDWTGAHEIPRSAGRRFAVVDDVVLAVDP